MKQISARTKTRRALKRHQEVAYLQVAGGASKDAPQLFVASAKIKQRGVALLLVLFAIALLSIIVVELAYSTNLRARGHVMMTRGVKAEYLMKSAVNLARTLIKEDKTDEDSSKDPWGFFIAGSAIPVQLLGVDDPAVTLSLEIRPEEAKIPIRRLRPRGTSGSSDAIQQRWRDILARLFQNLGFDDDQEEDQSEEFRGHKYTSQELVANLIDYQDADSDSYSAAGFASGFEAQSDSAKSLAKNEAISSITELSSIPGFTAGRIQKMMPYITVFGIGERVNINLAPEAVLRSLHSDINDDEVKAILSFRTGEDGPFTASNLVDKLHEIVGPTIYTDISTLIGVGSSWFQVIVKADYGNSSSFMRAYLEKAGPGTLPTIRRVEIF